MDKDLIKFEPNHLKKLIGIKHNKQNEIGANVYSWSKYVLRNETLPDKYNHKFSREQLYEFNNDKVNKTKHIVASILSWGGMRRDHGRLFFSDYEEIQDFLEDIRGKKIGCRKDVYKEFANYRSKGVFRNLGIAYFSKLMCFLNPDMNAYILDQWTAKSINLLLDQKLITLTDNWVNDDNGEEIYEKFCLAVEELGNILGISGYLVEEMLFSSGGRNKGDWREYVVNNYSKKTKNTLRIIPKSVKSNSLNLSDNLDNNKVLCFFRNKQFNLLTMSQRKPLKFLNKDGVITIINSANKSYVLQEPDLSEMVGIYNNLSTNDRTIKKNYSSGNKSDVSKMYLFDVIMYYLKGVRDE